MVREMRRRPLGIWIITILQLTLAGTLVVSLVTGEDLFAPIPGTVLAEEYRPVYVAWVAVAGMAALLLWRLSRRGWALTMLLTGLSLLANLVLWWNGEPYWTRMAIQVVIALYLNSAAVRQLFLHRTDVSRITVRGTGGE
jgi:hypothetical protein